jgi:hypothetical protein
MIQLLLSSFEIPIQHSKQHNSNNNSNRYKSGQNSIDCAHYFIVNFGADGILLSTGTALLQLLTAPVVSTVRAFTSLAQDGMLSITNPVTCRVEVHGPLGMLAKHISWCFIDCADNAKPSSY